MRESLIERIRALRLTQDALATVAGVFGSDVSRHVRGIRIAPARAKAIEITLEQIEELMRTPYAMVPNMADPASINAALENLVELREQESKRIAHVYAVAGQSAGIGE
jgi:hypothetical protein